MTNEQILKVVERQVFADMINVEDYVMKQIKKRGVRLEYDDGRTHRFSMDDVLSIISIEHIGLHDLIRKMYKEFLFTNQEHSVADIMESQIISWANVSGFRGPSGKRHRNPKKIHEYYENTEYNEFGYVDVHGTLMFGGVIIDQDRGDNTTYWEDTGIYLANDWYHLNEDNEYEMRLINVIDQVMIFIMEGFQAYAGRYIITEKEVYSVPVIQCNGYNVYSGVLQFARTKKVRK